MGGSAEWKALWKKREKEGLFMETEISDILKSKSLKVFIKRSFIIIGLFVFLYCGVDTLILLFGNNFQYNLIILGIILLSPIIVFFIILFWFLSFVNKISYWFTCNKDDLIIFNMKKIDEFIKIINSLNSNIDKKNGTLKEELQKKLIESFDECIKKLFSRRKEND